MPEKEFEKEIDLFDYFAVIYRNRRMIIGIVLISMILTSIYTLTRPPLYQASVTFFPLDIKEYKSVNEAGYSELKSKLVLEDLVISILKSREMADGIINDIDLKNIWGKKLLYDARIKLGKVTNISLNAGSVITVEVITDNPELSAKIANAYLDKLNNFNKELQLSTDVSLVQVIDRAVPPEKRIPRGLVKKSLLICLISFFIATFFVFILENIEKSGFKNKIKDLRKL